MRLFLDCEFNGFGGGLISMALVAEDGREWYEVVPCEQPEAWVVRNVIPILGKEPVSIDVMQRSLFLWLARFESIHIVADWPEDIAHFCSALITSPGRRISTPPLTMEVLKIDSQSTMPHNALHDARALREAVMHKEGI